MAEQLKTIEKAFAVLRMFSAQQPTLTVAELSRGTGLPRSVVTRIVATLESEGLLERSEESARYRVGFAACRLGAVYAKGHPLLLAADGPLRALASDTGYPVYLGTAAGAEAVIVATIEGSRSIRFVWAVGDRLPIATAALGKAMLMRLPAAEVAALLGPGPLPALTSRSLTAADKVQAELDASRAAGWIAARNESLDGVSAVGAAVGPEGGAAVAGISVSFVSDLRADLEELGRKVLRTARLIDERYRTLLPYSAQRVA